MNKMTAADDTESCPVVDVLEVIRRGVAYDDAALCYHYCSILSDVDMKL